jgi:hypothetical protein
MLMGLLLRGNASGRIAVWFVATEPDVLCQFGDRQPHSINAQEPLRFLREARRVENFWSSTLVR